MKILFNIDVPSLGDEQIKNLLGFTDADLRIKNLVPYIITATDEIIKVIGTNMYNVLIGIFESSSSSAADKEFLRRAQYAILLDATRNYFIDTDLGHTPNGRVNRVEENQKIAFEWQIDRSNKNAERKYYKAFDSLIHYMDNNVTDWKSTDAFKQTNELFVRNVDQFENFFYIDGSRLLYLKLLHGMRKAEKEEIQSRLSKQPFDELKAKLKNNQPVEDKILLELIQEAVVFSALSWGVARLSAQLFPEGLLTIADTSRLTTSAKKASEKNATEAISQRFAQDAAEALKKLESHINQPLPEPSTAPTLENQILFDPDDKIVNC